MTPHDIKLLACEAFGVKLEHLAMRRGSATVCMARHCAMYACRKVLRMSYEHIGGIFGRHHSTVMSACMRIGGVGDAFVNLVREKLR